MNPCRIVIDTNVIVAALWSQKGPSYRLLKRLGHEKEALVLEVAVESESQSIITYNKKDFVGIEKFGIPVVSPKEFLNLLGE